LPVFLLTGVPYSVRYASNIRLVVRST